ncbi:MAG: histidine phosphatase family protein [Bulleidia sp.]
MRLIFIRHGDPDYACDCLTEKGKKEAEYLAERMAKETMDAIYVSPLGRAQETASYTLRKTGRTAVTLEWLREFSPRICRPDHNGEKIGCWDWHPKDWTADERMFDHNDWKNNSVMAEGKVGQEYERVCREFDALIARHGYVNNALTYTVERPNHDTIVFFCHFGVQCVLISHLLHLPFVPVIHGLSAAPTGYTELVSQEVDEGIANFRMTCYGDISHLYMHDEQPSFTGRYCECFTDDTRH